jgi:hypothetical protein
MIFSCVAVILIQHKGVMFCTCPDVPIPVATHSKTCMVFDRSNSGIVGSNSARDMDVWPCFSALSFPG